MGSILVFVEAGNGQLRKSSLEALSAAAGVSDQVIAVLYGAGTSALGAEAAKYGATKIVAFDDASLQAYSPEGARARPCWKSPAKRTRTPSSSVPPPRAVTWLRELRRGSGSLRRPTARTCASSGDQVELLRPVYAGKAYTWVKAAGTPRRNPAPERVQGRGERHRCQRGNPRHRPAPTCSRP